jgi:hypothetical protein
MAEVRDAPAERLQSMSDWSERYNSMAAAVFGRLLPSDVRTIFLMSDYPKDSVWFDRCYQALLQIEFEYVEQLLQHAKGSKIVGDLVEFGIYQGAWINKFYEITTRSDSIANLGFDSFAGLSKPHEIMISTSGRGCMRYRGLRLKNKSSKGDRA